MSKDIISLTAKKRDVLGKQVRGLRANGELPAVVHEHGKPSLHISIDEAELRKTYAAAGKHHPVALTIDGKSYTTIIKEVTYKPATNKVYHSVFQSVKANETVKATVPPKLVGDIPAEKANLLVLQGLEMLEVEALPKDLVDAIELDASTLVGAGDKLTVADIKAPTGIQIKTDLEQLVASVEMPKDQVAEANAAVEEQAALDAAGEAPAEASDAPEADTEEQPAES